MATADSPLHISIKRRWFFWPAFVIAYALVMLHVVSERAAANWIASHVFRIKAL